SRFVDPVRVCSGAVAHATGSGTLARVSHGTSRVPGRRTNAFVLSCIFRATRIRDAPNRTLLSSIAEKWRLRTSSLNPDHSFTRGKPAPAERDRALGSACDPQR